MSHFSNTLRMLLDLEGISQEAYAKNAGIERTSISRYLSGRVPKGKHLASLVAAISFDRSRRLELMLAYLRDEAEVASVKAGIDERHYRIEAVGDTTAVLPDSLAADLEVLTDEAVQHEDLRNILKSLAHAIVRCRAEGAASVYPFGAEDDDAVGMVAEDEEKRRGNGESTTQASRHKA